jgi:hypothetical protein
MIGCSNNEEQQNANKSSEVKSNQHKVTILEIQSVSSYSYLKVEEEDKEYWIACPKAEFRVGQVLLYTNAMEMKDFTSKELNKTFDRILFVDRLESKLGEGSMTEPQKPHIEKENISVEQVSGGITIAQLYSNPNKYENKTVKIKGKVIKVNLGIMKKNWIHIQDGTSANNEFDLTITTNGTANIGDIVVVEGKIILNKDFGYGYSYKVLLEEAKISKSL